MIRDRDNPSKKEDRYCCGCFLWVIFILIELPCFMFWVFYDSEISQNGRTIFILVIVITILINIFLYKKNSKKDKKVIERYKNNNLGLEITDQDILIRIKLDTEQNILYLLENDNTGNIIVLPFADFISYDIFSYSYEDNKQGILEIKTSLDDPNLSVINLRYNQNDESFLGKARKMLEYVIGQQNKGNI